MENSAREELCSPVISYVEAQNSARNFDVRQNSMENLLNSPKVELSSEIKQTDNHNAKRCIVGTMLAVCFRGIKMRLAVHLGPLSGGRSEAARNI